MFGDAAAIEEGMLDHFCQTKKKEGGCPTLFD